jgi:hypothetical protein
MKPLLTSIIIVQLTVFAGKHDRVNVPVRVALTLPASVAEVGSVVLKTPDGTEILGQLAEPGLLAPARETREAEIRRELHFILPRLKAGEELALEATIRPDSEPGGEGFRWHDTSGEFTELRFGERPVMRYMYKALDDSTPESRELTYKVFHHLFDPSGKRLVTKGPGGKYTHHRGLFYGFNRVTYGDGQEVDIWHCTGDTHQAHAGFISSDEGPVLGRQRLAINWKGKGKETFAREQREMTVYNVPGGILVEFASRLRSADGKVRLDGDPQHAGFHFRADDEVAASTNGETYFLRPDGKGGLGETRNWPGHGDHVNLPWNAMSFVLGGRRYTVAYLDKPTNPKEARFSERDYGRFGSYFEWELDGAKSLDVNYRIWLQEGEMTVEQVAARSGDFGEPPGVTARVGTRAR